MKCLGMPGRHADAGRWPVYRVFDRSEQQKLPRTKACDAEAIFRVCGAADVRRISVASLEASGAMTVFPNGNRVALYGVDLGDPAPLEHKRLAHDLNNVLQIISGNLDLLASKCRHDGDEQRYVRSARAGLQLGTALARQILHGPSDPGEIERPIDAVLEGFEGLMRDAAGPWIDLVIQIGEGLPPIAGDACALKNAVLNLVINARDAIHGRGRIVVSFERGAADGALVVSVLDNGIGIDADALSRIFEPYYSTKASGRGTGLGLTTVATFARKAGAQLCVESCVGSGTRFELRIPAPTISPSL